MKEKKSTFSWIFSFAGQKKSGYIASVILAVIGAAFQILPFFVMAQVIGKLLAGNKDLAGYLIDCAVMAAFWLLRVLFHSLSTAQSHKATFAVLGNIRKQGLAKLAKMPLGDVQAKGSGELKNILVERVDSIEPTLAHAIPEMSSNAAVALATLIYLFVIDWRILYTGGRMELLNCVMLCICSFLLTEGLEQAGTQSSLLRVVDTCVDQAADILDLPAMDISGAELTPEHHDLHADHITFSYGEKQIIHGVTLDIPERTTTAIVGPSGGGKTTLCHLLSRFWDVDAGQVTLGGHDVREYDMDSLMRNFSFVFQNVYLFHDTIANNICFGQPDAPIEQVIAAAKKARCHDFIMKLPQGYDTVIGEAGGSLSGGERQRLSIARAMMKDAPIVILDEATANVDPENEQELMEAIQKLTQEKTVIMIAHRLKTVRHADQILVVDKGRIVQRGTHDELMKQDGIYRRFISGREQAVGWKLSHI